MIYDCLGNRITLGLLLSPDRKPDLPAIAVVTKVEGLVATVKQNGREVFIHNFHDSDWVQSLNQKNRSLVDQNFKEMPRK